LSSISGSCLAELCSGTFGGTEFSFVGSDKRRNPHDGNGTFSFLRTMVGVSRAHVSGILKKMSVAYGNEAVHGVKVCDEGIAKRRGREVGMVRVRKC
jgi:hypothetical protein